MRSRHYARSAGKAAICVGFATGDIPKIPLNGLQELRYPRRTLGRLDGARSKAAALMKKIAAWWEQAQAHVTRLIRSPDGAAARRSRDAK
jgi:hypothetical protein